MDIEHVFFDLDHTLWDFERNSAKTFNFIFEEHNIPVSLNDFLAVYIPLNHSFWKLYREEKISKSELRYQRLKQSFDAVHCTISDNLIDKLAVDYIENLANFNHLFDNALEILEHLKPKYKLHIITNGFEEIQDKKLKNSEIHNFFEHVITSESVGVKKPNPKIFEHALDLANTKASKSIMIGDSLEADILGAQKIGMHTLFFNVHEEKNHRQKMIINNLMEIKQYL